MLVAGAEVSDTLLLSKHVKLSALLSWKNSACHGAAINTMLRCVQLCAHAGAAMQDQEAEAMQSVVESGG